MTQEEARRLVEAEGLTVIEYTGEGQGMHFFECEGEKGTTVEVCVFNGDVLIAPTC